MAEARMAGGSAVPAFKEAGQGPVLLFLHGIGGNRHVFDPQLAHFAARGWRAVAWDAPGYGDSAAPSAFDWPELAARVPLLLDALQAPRAVIVGHSMGGMLAQEVAARHPERLRALVLSGTAAAFAGGGAWQKRFLAERLGPLDAGRSMADLAPELMRRMVAPGAAAEAVAAAAAAMAQVPAPTYRAMLAALTRFDRQAALAQIRLPCLLIAGAEDRTAPPAVMSRMAAAIPGADYAVIPGAGHVANLEKPAAFNDLLDAFLRRLPPV